MKRFAAGFGALAFFAAVGPASAGTITYNLPFVFSGTTQPLNLLTAVFDDGGGTGSVTLTMSMSGPSLSEFVSEWFFNFNGDPTALNFQLTTNTTGSGTDPSVGLGSNAFQADGDGLYDINIGFDIAPPAERFGTGETVAYTITAAGITANSFNALSFFVGGSGPFFTAAHVQGICLNPPDCDQTASAWVTIPEPGPALLFGAGSLLAGVAIRRRR